jgi:hypothetical protein
MDFIDKLLSQNAALKIEQVNPKRGKSAGIYEKYKLAVTANGVLQLGGKKVDLKNDLSKGMMQLTDTTLSAELTALLGHAITSTAAKGAR